MLSTLAGVKAYLGIAPSDETNDVFLTFQLSVVSEAIEGYCGRKFESADYTQFFYSDEMRYSQQLPVFHYPIVSIFSIFEDTVELTQDYRVETDLGFIVREKSFWLPNVSVLGNEKVTVNYKAGYAIIPYPVQYVLFSIIQEKYNKKKAGIDINFGTDIQRVSIPGALSIDFDYTLDANQRQNAYGNILGNYLNVLDPYRSERSIIGRMGRIYIQPYVEV